MIARLVFYISDRPGSLGAKQQHHLVIPFRMSIPTFYYSTLLGKEVKYLDLLVNSGFADLGADRNGQNYFVMS